jgi:RNA polymerase sigma-70 factor, ECF subfamily
VLLCGDRAEAEDALQEAFARAAVGWRRLRSYQAPEAWVRRVALNLTRMAARRLRRRTAALLGLGSVPATAELSAETIDLLVGLRALPLAQRQVLVLHHLVGLPVGGRGRPRAGPAGRHGEDAPGPWPPGAGPPLGVRSRGGRQEWMS